MNIKLRAASKLLTIISIFAIAVALVRLTINLFGPEPVIFTIISGLVVYAIFCFYQILLTMEKIKELNKNNK